MITYQPMEQVTYEDFERITPGYTSHEKYVVRKAETPECTTFALELVALDTPYERNWMAEGLGIDAYNEVIGEGHSWGAFDGETMVGLAIAEQRNWNKTLWVWEFGVAKAIRRQGVGRALMGHLETLGRELGLRCLTLECQNTNVPAIRFYRAVGFEIEGLDMALYAGPGPSRNEVAFYMRRHLNGN